MHDTLVDLAVNVAANIIAAFLVGSAALLVLTRYRSRGLKRFFGFSPGRTELKIYLSTIAVNKQGTTGTAVISEGFFGDAMTEIEYRHALAFASRVTGGSASWVLTTVFGARAGAEQIMSIISQSPSFRNNARGDDDEVKYDEQHASSLLREKACVVLIGSPIYNLLTHHVLRQRPTGTLPQRFFEFIRDRDETGRPRRGIRALGGISEEEFIRQESATGLKDYFIVEKMTIGETKLFVCAGTCTAATAAAVDKLINWRYFEERFGSKDFGVLYRIHLPGSATNPEARESNPDEHTAVELVCEFKKVAS